MSSKPDYGDSHVIVIDDMNSTRALLEDMLRDLGFKFVSTARNGIDALQQMSQTTVDLIISDELMDGMCGTELLEKVRAKPELAHIPFILVTSLRDAPAIDTALDLGVDDYIPKPISISLLRRKIEDVFRRRMAPVRVVAARGAA
jgi:two-component system chemotaxis response regulator CheY